MRRISTNHLIKLHFWSLEANREMNREHEHEELSPGIVVDAKPVAAGFAHGVLPVQVALEGHPVVEDPLLKIFHHRLVPPHPVACSTCCSVTQH